MIGWHERLTDRMKAAGTGGFILEFPAYRPDLVTDLASALGCVCLDFRKTCLAPLRFEAHKLPLSALETATEEHTAGNGIVLQNGEALLACKSADERRMWFQEFLDRKRDCLVILPLALFGREVPPHPNLFRFLPHELPTESLLAQLMTISVRQ